MNNKQTLSDCHRESESEDERAEEHQTTSEYIYMRTSRIYRYRRTDTCAMWNVVIERLWQIEFQISTPFDTHARGMLHAVT